ncbi:MAG: hypothetical protein GY787_30915 [Alteromonadales bacterium]|nr:hypothetical protein [Alteromonadales bacterium]
MPTIFYIILLLVLFMFIKRKFSDKTVETWKYRAVFAGDSGQTIGNLGCIESKMDNESELTFKASLSMQHPDFTRAKEIEVFFDELLILKGTPDMTGDKAFLDRAHHRIIRKIDEPKSGTHCIVKCEGKEIARTPLKAGL